MTPLPVDILKVGSKPVGFVLIVLAAIAVIAARAKITPQKK